MSVSPVTTAPVSFVPADSVVNAYRTLTLKGWSAIVNGATIADAARTHSVTVKDVASACGVKCGDDGRLGATAYRIVNAADMLLQGGYTLDTLKSMTESKLTRAIGAMLNRAYLGTFGGAGNSRADIEPRVIAAISAIETDDVDTLHATLTALEATVTAETATAAAKDKQTRSPRNAGGTTTTTETTSPAKSYFETLTNKLESFIESLDPAQIEDLTTKEYEQLLTRLADATTALTSVAEGE